MTMRWLSTSSTQGQDLGDPQARCVGGHEDSPMTEAGVRLAIDDPRPPQPVETPRGPVHDPAASYPRPIAGDLEPPSLGLAADRRQAAEDQIRLSAHSV